jgi:hypothetical protein
VTPVVPFVTTLVIVPEVAESTKPRGVSVPKLGNAAGVTVMVEVVPVAPTVAPELIVAGTAAMVMAGGVRRNWIDDRLGAIALPAKPGFGRHVYIVTSRGLGI